MSMPKKLLLINGFPDGIKVLQLVKFLQTYFREENVCKVWMDPYKEPRAVAMFETSLDGEKIHRLNGNLLWDNQLITFDVIGPTQLVFVRTYGTMNNTPEIELKSLFTQRNASYNCAVIKKLDAYCYCISFQKDWDAVLEVCELSWKYHDQHLSLFPYFGCFSASVEYQYDSLLKKSKKGCKPTIYDSKQESVSRNTSFPSVERKQSIDFKEKFSGYSNVTNDTFKEIMPRKSYLEKFTIVFAHPFLPKLLFLLNIHKGVEKHNCYITNECTASLAFEIQGDKIFFKKLNQLFNKEFEKLRDSPIRNDFLGLEKVQPYLKEVILFLKAFVTLTLNNDLLFIDVSTNENKYSFEDFVGSLVQTNKYSLPSNQDLKNEEWESFVQHFNEKNTCIQIFQSKLVVQIVYLSHFSECLKDSLDAIDNKINDIFVLIQPTVITSQKDCVGATSGIKFFDQSTQAKPQKDMRNVSKVYIMKYPFIAKILSALSVEKAVQEKYPFLTLEVCDQAIKISGQKHDVEECLDVLHHQEEMITLQQSKPNFLEDYYSQLKVLTLIQSSEHSISFENTLPKTELYVLVEPDHKTKLLFREYLTSLLISTDNFKLPDNDFENNNKWKKFITDFRNQYPYCQIIVTDDSQVFLFFVQNTDDEKIVHFLKNIVDKTISSMLENCTSNIAASKHSENTNKCTWKRTTDFDLSIHEKHLICYDINKTEVWKEKSAMITTKNYEAATNVTSQCLTKFHWMYENETAAELNVRKTFQQIEQNISNLIEAAYIQDNGEIDLDIDSGPYGHVDFSKMTIVFNEQARRLIRTEKFSDLPDQNVLPDTWQNMNLDVWRLFEVGPSEKEFSDLLNALETDLNSETNKVEILKVQRLQNINLFKHYKMKSSLMQKPIHSIFLWQRIALDTQELVCQHGFHPIFCAIHDAEDLGSGNLFFEKSGRCLHTRDFVDNTTVCLLYSEVLVGKSGQGKRSMRLPPFDKEANVMYDSVKLDDAYLVFSDVQAYPSYFVMINMIKND